MKPSNFFSAALAARMQGDDFEHAYAKIFGGRVVGGPGDKGKDVRTSDTRVPYVQVKSSLPDLIAFVAVGLKHNHENPHKYPFIPVCLGEPGTKEEMVTALLEFGAWVGVEIPHRLEIMNNVQKARSLFLKTWA